MDQKKMRQVFGTYQLLEATPIAHFAGLGPDALSISGEDFKA